MGQGFYAIEQLIAECEQLHRGFVLNFGERDAAIQGVLRVEPQVESTQRAQAADHESGASKRSKRERDFSNHESVAEAARHPDVAGAAATVDRLTQLLTCDMKRGREAEEQAGEY